MDNVNLRSTHPLIVTAAIAVLLTCLLAIGVMTGIVPSPMNRGADKQELTTTPPNSLTASTTTRETTPSGTATTRESRTVTRAPASEPRRLTEQRTAPAPATGATSSSTSTTVAAAGPAPAPAAPACSNCGTVTSVRAIKQQGDASMIGPAAGALLGGLAGRQIGGGSGKTIATVAGAGVGAAAGTEIERRYKSTTNYVVAVRMNDGSHRSFNYSTAPNVQAGSKVRVVDGTLVHD
jgi:outer membrane lipoprotein SlyB